MRFAFSLKQSLLGVIVAVTADLALLPSPAQAMVGDVPSMPQTEQTTVTTNTTTSGGTTSSGPGGPGSPNTTPEPSALLSGLLGLGLLCIYQAVGRAIHLGTIAPRGRALLTLHHSA